MGRMSTKTPTQNNVEALKENVQKKFAEIRAALQMREKLLLRQLDVIAAQQHMQVQMGRVGRSRNAGNNREAEVKFIAEREDVLLTNIRSFGNFQFMDNMMLQHLQLLQHDVYNLPNEDYITPSDDHEIMYKCLKIIDNNNNNKNDDQQDDDDGDEMRTTIVIDFAQKNKLLMENNRRQANESIINLTLQEAKQLICRAATTPNSHSHNNNNNNNNDDYDVVPPLNLKDLNDDDDDADDNDNDDDDGLPSIKNHKNKHHNQIYENKMKGSKIHGGNAKKEQHRFKPKITINNCNGTINLRNIANLTINCNSEEAINAQIPLQQTDNSSNIITTTTTTTSNSNEKQTPIICRKAKKSWETKATNNNFDEGEEEDEAPDIELVDNDDYDEDEEKTAATCDFYNRLLNEIKKTIVLNSNSNSSSSNFKQSLKQQQNINYDDIDTKATTTTIGTEASSSVLSSTGPEQSHSSMRSSAGGSKTKNNRRFVLKNFENLKIILETNSDEENSHPVQIEQWLAEIISETDVEPIYNKDILEHSQIDSNEST